MRIIALGHRMPSWVREVTDEYTQRMPRETPLELVELKPEARVSGRTTEQILETESRRVLALLQSSDLVVVLDERGDTWRTQDLAKTINGAQREGQDLVFIIGSADGLHDAVRARGQKLFALSRLTLPHGMARAILTEQLYRACSLLKGHPYHRE